MDGELTVVMIGPFAFLPKGTVSGRAFHIARALVNRGHRVTILMPPYDNAEDSGRVWERDGVRLENARIQGDGLWQQIRVPPWLARRTARLGPDVVHVFKPIGYGALAGAYLRWFSRLPLVLDTDDWEGTGGWNDVNPYPAVWKWFFDWQERWMPRHSKAVTVASRTLQAQLWGFGVNPEHVLYLPNGPDVGLRQWDGISEEKQAQVRSHLGVGEAPFVLYMGNIPLGSDMDLAIDALARIVDRVPQARMVIAGAGDGLPGLKAHAAALGLADRVVFPGWIDHQEANDYVATADAIVNPYRDSLINRSKCALKGVAAMAMGKAVVSSRVGQNLEYIEHGRSGLLARPGDPDSLAECLLAVLSDRNLAQKLGQNAKLRIWEEFDWDARIGQVEGLYRSAMKRSRGRR